MRVQMTMENGIALSQVSVSTSTVKDIEGKALVRTNGLRIKKVPNLV